MDKITEANINSKLELMEKGIRLHRTALEPNDIQLELLLLWLETKISEIRNEKQTS